MQQIILNLINNAIKFTTIGTITLTISTYLIAEKNKVLRFSIKDTGNGMSEEKQKQIAQLLDKNDVELQNNTEINETGICLGLSISQILAKMLGPKEPSELAGISFKSEEGKGSEFEFYLEN